MIECVPNVSEGRDSVVLQQIAGSITGCRVLDIHSDSDHHRSVFTMVGNEQEIVDGAVALIESAIALIDISSHQGVHPRIGAVDVMPFIPLEDRTMAQCVALATRVGRIAADRFEVPVLLYGAAARVPDRVTLPSIRRGGLPGLAKRLAERPPDFGPAQLHPTAGAIAIGARPLLVAYNVVLDSPEVSVARKIASHIREANGGLPGVKALGLHLASLNLAQVSMNLTDVVATAIPDAFRAVKQQAGRLGVDVLASEIVGLVPRAALLSASANDLLLPADPSQWVLEERIKEREA